MIKARAFDIPAAKIPQFLIENYEAQLLNVETQAQAKLEQVEAKARSELEKVKASAVVYKCQIETFRLMFSKTSTDRLRSKGLLTARGLLGEFLENVILESNGTCGTIAEAANKVDTFVCEKMIPAAYLVNL